MNGLVLGIPDFAKMRRTLLASVLGLGLVALWPSAAFGFTMLLGPSAALDSATDDGGGVIRISWSLEEVPSGSRYVEPHPSEVCVSWAEVVDGQRGALTETCFTTEVSSQADLLVDTGIGGDGPSAVYAVLLFSDYGEIRKNPPNNDFTYTQVTLNDGGDETPSVEST